MRSNQRPKNRRAMIAASCVAKFHQPGIDQVKPKRQVLGKFQLEKSRGFIGQRWQLQTDSSSAVIGDPGPSESQSLNILPGKLGALSARKGASNLNAFI